MKLFGKFSFKIVCWDKKSDWECPWLLTLCLIQPPPVFLYLYFLFLTLYFCIWLESRLVVAPGYWPCVCCNLRLHPSCRARQSSITCKYTNTNSIGRTNDMLPFVLGNFFIVRASFIVNLKSINHKIILKKGGNSTNWTHIWPSWKNIRFRAWFDISVQVFAASVLLLLAPLYPSCLPTEHDASWRTAGRPSPLILGFEINKSQEVIKG